MNIDSRPETYKHILTVQNFLNRFIREFTYRGQVHDRSKLATPEVELFDEFTPKLAGSTYGSDEYKALLSELKPALDHHYANNTHHPEYYDEGIRGMDLCDLVEMLCDWKAATLRHHDGSIRESIQINQKRFGYSDDLKEIMLNTVNRLFE